MYLNFYVSVQCVDFARPRGGHMATKRSQPRQTAPLAFFCQTLKFFIYVPLLNINKHVNALSYWTFPCANAEGDKSGLLEGTCIAKHWHCLY